MCVCVCVCVCVCKKTRFWAQQPVMKVMLTDLCNCKQCFLLAIFEAKFSIFIEQNSIVIIHCYTDTQIVLYVPKHMYVDVNKYIL